MDLTFPDLHKSLKLRSTQLEVLNAKLCEPFVPESYEGFAPGFFLAEIGALFCTQYNKYDSL